MYIHIHCVLELKKKDHSSKILIYKEEVRVGRRNSLLISCHVNFNVHRISISNMLYLSGSAHSHAVINHKLLGGVWYADND